MNIFNVHVHCSWKGKGKSNHLQYFRHKELYRTCAEPSWAKIFAPVIESLEKGLNLNLLGACIKEKERQILLVMLGPELSEPGIATIDFSSTLGWWVTCELQFSEIMVTFRQDLVKGEEPYLLSYCCRTPPFSTVVPIAWDLTQLIEMVDSSIFLLENSKMCTCVPFIIIQ